MAFYTRALINLCAMARRRFPFILQIYVILRDARHKGWTPPPPNIGEGAHHLHEQGAAKHPDSTSSRHVGLLLLPVAYSTRRIPLFVAVQAQDQDRGKGGRSGGNFAAGGRHVQAGGNCGGSRRGRIIHEVVPVARFCGVAGNLTPLQTLFSSKPFLYLGRAP